MHQSGTYITLDDMRAACKGGATTFSRKIVSVHSPCVVCVILPSIRLLHKNHVGRGACAKLEKKEGILPR